MSANIRCEKCGHTRPAKELQPMTRFAEGRKDVLEVGFLCPACGHFYRAAFTNDKLMRMQREIDLVRHPAQRAKLARAYKRKFDAFQKEVEAAKERMA